MSDSKYDIVPIRSKIDRDQLVKDVTAYMYSRLVDCQIEQNRSCNTYTILISPASSKDRGRKKAVNYITIIMIMYEDSCAISFKASKARPVFNVALAAVSAPVFLPGSAVFLGTAAYRLWYMSNMKKELIKFIKAYSH